MTEQAFEDKITLGFPGDIVGPIIPTVLRRVHAEISAVKVELVSFVINTLKEQFFNGEIDIVIITEPDVSSGGEILKTTALRWFGAPNGKAWQERPLPYSAFKFCSFNLTTLACLDQANISWKLVSNSKSERVTEATVAADLAVTTAL
jgi:DNA-binding transcriptional LysR family regulator